MLKVFKATDKTYSSNGDLIVNPLKAQVHKEDNGEFYLDLETPFNEKEVSIAKEEGTYTTITGTATIQNVSTSKLQEVLQLDGDTTQETTTGANIYYMNYADYTYNNFNGTNITSTHTGYSISGKATSNTAFTLTNRYIALQAGTYTVAIKKASAMRLGLSKTNYSSVARIQIGSTSTTFTLTEATNVCLTLEIINGTTYNESNEVMVYSGTESKPFEPYTNGASPNPTYPQPINVVSGRQEIVVAGKNLFNKNTITSITNGTITNNVITSNAISSNYGGVSSTISGLTLEAGTYYISLKLKRDSGTSGNKLTRITLVGIDSSQITMVDNPNITNEYQIYSCRISPATQITLTNIGIQLQPTNVNAVMSYTDIMISKDNNTTYEAYKGQTYEINLGKNLINPNNAYTGTSNGIATTYNENQSLSFSGTTTGTWFYLTNKININLPSGDYTFSIDKTVSSHTVIIRMFYNETQYQDITINKNTTSRTVNVSNNTIAYQVYCGGITIGTEVNDTLFFQLEKGSSASSFSPYKTPIELCKIGNYKDRIFRLEGTNLFDKNNITSGKRLGQNGQLVDDTNYFTSDFIPVKEETWYTKNSPTIDAYHRICYYSSNNESSYISRVDDNSFPTPANTKYVRFCGALTEVDTTMFNEGNTALPYEPYGNAGTWYIEKQIGKVVLNGSESWTHFTVAQGELFRSNDAITDDTTTDNKYVPYCNYYTGLAFYYVGNRQNNNIYIANDANNLDILDNRYTDANDFKTWLSTHNTEVYYELETPTYTEITDEELLTQINSIKLIEGLNNVSITSPYLTAPIYIHYNYINEVSYSIKYNDYLVPNNIIVANTPQGEQAFRISNVEKTRRKIKIKANHVFYDSANLLIQDSYVVDKNCNDALDHLNNATSDLSPFTTISNINVIDSYRCVRKSLFQAIQVVIERWGGHLVRDNWTIGVYDTIGQDNGVTIRYAKNLKDITATYIWDDVVTKLLPVGKDGILLNELDPTASVYVESAVKYDIPYTKTISFEQNSIIEDDYKDENGTLILEDYKQALIDDLYAQAIEYITNNYLPKVNYTLSANVEKISDIGDTIEVIDEKLGINIMTNVISYNYDCILDKYIEIEFGNFTPELSNLMNSITENTERIVREENSTLAITLGRELEEATDKIWSALGNSYVIYDGDKILVVDSLPKETATNVIMINNGGIGFSNTGITGTFSSAWTIDNVLNMENINVINLTADLIKGGTLKLGSNLNQNGQIEVYDEANSLIAELNKNGLKMYGVDGSYVLMNNQVGFAGYDRNDNPIYWVNGDEFHMKKSVVEEEITLVNKMRIIPITIRDGNNQIVNDGIGFVNVAN